MVAREQLRVVRCGGSWLSGSRAVFSADSKYLLCASGDYVKVYSTATEECLHVLQGHSNIVTGVQLNPQNHLQLYSWSLDGTIKLWDFMDGILIKTLVVGFKLFAFYALAGSENSSGPFQLASLKIPKTPGQEVEANELELILDGVSQSPKCTALGREGEYVVSAYGSHLVVCFFRKKKLYRCLGLPPPPSSITGYAVLGCNGSLVQETIWRADRLAPVLRINVIWQQAHTVLFGLIGTSLLSGGIESVLVQWRDGSDAKKEFLPPVGIHNEQHISVSPDGAFLCTSHADNKIIIIHSNLKVSTVIQGIEQSDVKAGLMVDPRTKALVLNGKPGHLQFYSLQNDKQLYNLDIVQQEYIHEHGLNQIELVKAAFDSEGNWLATVEQRQGSSSDLEMYMKLWAYDEQKQSFTLNTRINMPHEDCVTAMCFRCTDASENITPTLVTAGNDGHFKVWMLLIDNDGENQSITWACDFVGSYHNYQATNCCFSEDGSLLAVSFDKIVTVWDSELWDLKCTFCHLPGTIRNLCFGRQSCSKYLLGTTNTGFLCCWNLLSCTLEWSAQLNVIVLQPDCLSENIVAVSSHSAYSDVFVFKPCEPQPLCIHRKVCRGQVRCAVFVPRDLPESIHSEKYQWLSQSQFYFLTETLELMTFSTKSPEERLTPSSRQLAVEESFPMTPFYLLLGKHQQQNKEATETGRLPIQKNFAQESPAVKELLHTPAHVLPSASFLCPIFINSLLISKANKSTTEVANEVEMESDNSENESEEEEDTEVAKMDSEAPQATDCLEDNIPPKLSKEQEKKLRQLRKMDYSWASVL
uniref:WD repeat-containing protein 75-like n=1 Tax=Podarcis muralis TaxID=64176 RepID=UPI00109F418A|nr:WD repeat-containing protein 75-like [Podarcis muralis]